MCVYAKNQRARIEGKNVYIHLQVITISVILRSTSYAQTTTYYRQARAPLIYSVFEVFFVCARVKQRA